MSWDDYELDDPREWEECPFCRHGLEHSVGQHVEGVKEARERDLGRERALYRNARLVYETDRLMKRTRTGFRGSLAAAISMEKNHCQRPSWPVRSAARPTSRSK